MPSDSSNVVDIIAEVQNKPPLERALYLAVKLSPKIFKAALANQTTEEAIKLAIQKLYTEQMQTDFQVSVEETEAQTFTTRFWAQHQHTFRQSLWAINSDTPAEPEPFSTTPPFIGLGRRIRSPLQSPNFNLRAPLLDRKEESSPRPQ